jgi:hypothetical protein
LKLTSRLKLKGLDNCVSSVVSETELQRQTETVESVIESLNGKRERMASRFDRIAQNGTERHRTERNSTKQNETVQSRAEQDGTGRNRTEQGRIGQNRAEHDGSEVL